MTNEEAIVRIKDHMSVHKIYEERAIKITEALNMAIEALKAQGTCGDAVSRQTLQKELALYSIDDITSEDEAGYNRAINDVQKMVLHLPSAQPEITLETAIEYLHNIGWMQEHDRILTKDRDMPKKPNETTDRAWGVPNRQAVCPNCDSYLGTIHFICEGDKRKISYCESCGQAIDWEGWEEDD